MMIQSLKTTSMENVSTGVLSKSDCYTMPISFVYFQLLKWAVHQGCFYQHSNDNFFRGGGGGGEGADTI